MKSPHATGGEMGGSPEGGAAVAAGMSPQDVLHAWRDFECSFFAGALLAPKGPFRRFLARESLSRRGRREDRAHAGGGHAPHDEGVALPLLAFLRCLSARIPARGVPRQRHSAAVGQHGAGHRSVPELGACFACSNDRGADRGSQISVLRDGERSLLYCCHSRRTDDMAGNPHVLSVGIDLVPALRSHGADADKHRREHHRCMPAPPRRGAHSPSCRRAPFGPRRRC